jgi:hypothetical protein
MKISRRRTIFLFLFFYLICLGLGYPSLNRVDWRKGPSGLTDVEVYAQMVVSTPSLDPDVDNHMQYRILLPYMARPIYHLAENRLGTWDPIMFGLLVVNSLFVAGTVVLLAAVVSSQMGYVVGLGSAFIYLLNFAVPNLRLVGLIDAGEGFFLMAVTWSLWEGELWILPILGFLGAMAKESFVPFLLVFTLSWWLYSRKANANPAASAAWTVASWVAAFAGVAVAQWIVLGVFRSPLRFGLSMHHNTAYLSHFLHSLADRRLWYIFVWLLPLSLFRLRQLPAYWRFACLTTSITAFAMDAYYGGDPGTIGRALFTIVGPLLSASVALLLLPENVREAQVVPPA